MQKPGSLSLVADDKARSSVWSVRTLDFLAALQKQLLDDSRHWELVLTLVFLSSRILDLHHELQKILGKRVCQAQA